MRMATRSGDLLQDIDRSRGDDGDGDERDHGFGAEEDLHAARQGHRIGGREARTIGEGRVEVVGEFWLPSLGSQFGVRHLRKLQVQDEFGPGGTARGTTAVNLPKPDAVDDDVGEPYRYRRIDQR